MKRLPLIAISTIILGSVVGAWMIPNAWSSGERFVAGFLLGIPVGLLGALLESRYGIWRD